MAQTLQATLSVAALLIMYSLTFMVKFILGGDTLFTEQTMTEGQRLVSEGERFVLGFFSPERSKNKYLGIWYKATPDIVVWVANRNHPIRHHSQGILTVSRNGTLVLSAGETVIWSTWGLSTGCNVASSNPVVQLLQSGNLVVINGAAASKNNYTWQSFDYPCDTRLPGMEIAANLKNGKGPDKYLTSWRSSDDPSPGDFTYRIENHALPELVIYQGKVKTCRLGHWNGQVFNNIRSPPNIPFNLNLEFNERRVSISDTFTSNSLLTRMTLDKEGFLKRYTLNEKRNEWNVVYTVPRDPCDRYDWCGSNAICNINTLTRCQCLKGFAPRSQKEWDLRDWSSGCARINPPNCHKGDGFLKGDASLPDLLQFQLNMSLNSHECHAQCSKNCSCTAYAPLLFTDGSSGSSTGCLMWFGDLIDMREPLGEQQRMVHVYVRVPISELESFKDLDKKLISILTAVGVLITSALIYWGILVRLRQRRQGYQLFADDIELPSFSFPTIATATRNFSSENMIGEGGYGPVYRGCLSDGKEIAVKRLSKTSRQGLEEFKAEVSLIAKLQHRNLVRLLGYCTKKGEWMLIYEYMQNKSLDTFIFDQDRRTKLSWPKRFNIIMGIARGLLYLHHDSRLKIIHRDLKANNILLDENLNPKISDFGLARIMEVDQGFARTRRVVGTYGYMSPEYAFHGEFSIKSDVYSIGIVILETISGQKIRDFRHSEHGHSLLGHAWLLWKEDKTTELMDECLIESYVETQVKRCIHVGLLCVQKEPIDRPLTSSVLLMLGNEEGYLPDPKEPGFLTAEMSSINEETSHPEPQNITNTVTMTDLEAR